MALSDEDYFILSRVVAGIQQRIKELALRTDNPYVEEMAGMMAGLRDVINELAKK